MRSEGNGRMDRRREDFKERRKRIRIQKVKMPSRSCDSHMIYSTNTCTHLRCSHVVSVISLQEERSRYMRLGQFLLKWSAVLSVIL